MDKIVIVNNKVVQSKSIVNVVSLGYNCEASQRIEDALGPIDSYPFTWCAQDQSRSISTIINPSSIFDSKYELIWNGKGLKFSECGVSFHLRESCYKTTFNGTTITDETKLEYQKRELFMRLKHLISKWNSLLDGTLGDVLFILKLDTEITLERQQLFATNLVNYLNKRVKCKWSLIIVTNITPTINIEQKNVHIHTISNYDLNNSSTELKPFIINRLQWLSILQKYVHFSTNHYLKRTNKMLLDRYNLETIWVNEPHDQLNQLRYYEGISHKNPKYRELMFQLILSNTFELPFNDAINKLITINRSYNVGTAQDLLSFILTQPIVTYSSPPPQLCTYLNKIKSVDDRDVQFLLGRIYHLGTIIQKNLNKALFHYDTAIQLNHTLAKPAYMDTLKEIGTEDSLKQMLSFGLQNSNDGNVLVRLFRIYRDGIGIEKNYEQAIYYGEKAINNGQIWLKPELLSLLAKMSSSNANHMMSQIDETAINNHDYKTIMQLAKIYASNNGQHYNKTLALSRYTYILDNAPDQFKTEAISAIDILNSGTDT